MASPIFLTETQRHGGRKHRTGKECLAAFRSPRRRAINAREDLLGCGISPRQEPSDARLLATRD